MQADEIVLRWDGWSFALPTPNLRADTTGPARDPNHQLPYRFEWDFQIPAGRLPALRFADRYQMRVRIADLAGGGLGLEEVDDDETASESMHLPAPRPDPTAPRCAPPAGSRPEPPLTGS